MVRRKSKGDVDYYVHGRKKPVAYSTTATSDMLRVLSEEWKVNVLEMHERLDGLVGVEDEKKILDILIKKGCGKSFLKLH